MLLINQVRYKIGVMFGDPRVKPGGKGQDFATSVEILMDHGKYEMDDPDDLGMKKPFYANMRFKITKTRVSPSNMDGEYKMLLMDTELKMMPQILDEEFVVLAGIKHGILKLAGDQVTMKVGEDHATFKSKGALEQFLVKNPLDGEKLKEAVVSDIMESKHVERVSGVEEAKVSGDGPVETEETGKKGGKGAKGEKDADVGGDDGIQG